MVNFSITLQSLLQMNRLDLLQISGYVTRGISIIRLSMIVRVNVVLSRTVVVDSDWGFNNLCSSHPQGQRWLPHRLSKCQSLSTKTVKLELTFCCSEPYPKLCTVLRAVMVRTGWDKLLHFQVHHLESVHVFFSPFSTIWITEKFNAVL